MESDCENEIIDFPICIGGLINENNYWNEIWENRVVQLEKHKSELSLNKDIENLGLTIDVLLITDIINSNSQVVVLGEKADVVEKAFGVKLENNTAFLPGVVSRKKQVIPVLTANV